MFILVRGNIVFSAFTGKCRTEALEAALCWLWNDSACPRSFVIPTSTLKEKIFSIHCLTKSKDGAAERHDELSVLEHLGLGLELHGPHHQDDHAGHEEGHAEVEQRQSPAETLVAVTENRWMNGLDENLMFCQRINYSRR